jgi:formyl-CoA transferase
MGVYPASDGDMLIGASGQAQYRKLCEAIGAPELLADPRFATADARLANRPAFNAALSAVTRSRRVQEWVPLLNAAGIACGPINAIDQVFADPQVQASGIAQRAAHPRLGEIGLLGSPIRLSASEACIATAAPEKGADTDAVLREAGYAEPEIAALRRAGTVA